MSHSSQVPTLSATLIKNRTELNQLAPEWNSLLQQSAADSIFLTWEWVSSWLDTVSPSASLFVVAVRNGEGRLVAIAPFYCSTLQLLGLIHYRCLRVLGDCHSGGEYPDIIVLPILQKEALRAISEVLVSSEREWECAWIPNVAGWTGAAERFMAALGEARGFLHKRASSFSALDLPESWEEFAGRLSHKRRSDLRRQERRLADAGFLSVQRCENFDALPQFMETLFDLHGKHWQQAGQKGSFVRRPRMVDFYRDFAPKALANGWLALFSLAIKGTPCAVQYGFLYNGVYLALQEGYDPNGPNNSGNVLRAEIFRWCMEKRLRGYDFLGVHTLHKANWCALERWGWQIFLGRNTVKNLPLSLLKLWPTGRFLRQTSGCLPQGK